MDNNENNKHITAFIVGDSTSSFYGNDYTYAKPRRSWGMYFNEFVMDNVVVENYAIPGRSSKSFTQEQRYADVFSKIKKDDFLLIKFGHNDEKNSKPDDRLIKFTNPYEDKEIPESFKYYLYNYYIRPAREKGAIPVLLTSLSRRCFNEHQIAMDTHAPHSTATRQLAKEENVPLVDVNEMSLSLRQDIGPEGDMYLQAVYKDFSMGSRGIDNTHNCNYGARVIATLIGESLVQLGFGGKLIDEKKLKSKQNIYIRRGEFLNDLIFGMGQNVLSTENFKDVDLGKSYAEGLSIAKTIGLAVGDVNGNFYPEDFITREDLMYFSARALKFIDSEQTVNMAVLDKFKDKDDISEYARSAVAEIMDRRYLSATEEGFIYPKAYATRRQASVIIYKIYEYLNEVSY